MYMYMYTAKRAESGYAAGSSSRTRTMTMTMKRQYLAPALALLVVALLGGGAAWARAREAAPSPALYTTALDQVPVALAVDARRDHIFAIPATGPTGSMLDAETGVVLGAVPAHGGAAAADEGVGTVLVTGDAGVTMLDAASGRVRRVVPMSVAPDSIAVDPRAGHAFVVDPGSNTVRTLDTRTGAIVRTMSAVMTPSGVAVDTRTERVFVTSDSPFVSVLDARTGAAGSTLVVRTPGHLTIDPGSGRAFVVGAGAATVAMLDMRSGALLHTTTVAGGVVALALDPRRERAYAVSRDGGWSFSPAVAGTLTVLDARSGAVVKTYQLGFNPTAVAVDARSGRIFIASGVGATVEPDRWRWLPSWLRDKLPFLPPPGPHVRVRPPGVTAFAAPSYGN